MDMNNTLANGVQSKREIFIIAFVNYFKIVIEAMGPNGIYTREPFLTFQILFVIRL